MIRATAHYICGASKPIVINVPKLDLSTPLWKSENFDMHWHSIIINPPAMFQSLSTLNMNFVLSNNMNPKVDIKNFHSIGYTFRFRWSPV